MSQLTKRYDFRSVEKRWRDLWNERGIYRFDPDGDRPIYAIDTPPPTVSGNLHIGHVFSYTHADIIARFRRMRGDRVFYPFGFDDNGLASERFVEQEHGVSVRELDRPTFEKLCLETTRNMEKRFEALWNSVGLSVDWNFRYRTIEPLAQRISQRSFIELYRNGRAYRKDAPSLWCPECQTAIAQAELEDRERKATWVELRFEVDGGEPITIGTTRPELLPACAAIFVHPQDGRYIHLIGKQARTPLFDEAIPTLADERADPELGTGIVMCCTFGDVTDIEWWNAHDLPLKLAIDRNGQMSEPAGRYAGLPLTEARTRILEDLKQNGTLLGERAITHTVNVHERCGTEVEFLVTRQWFIRVLDLKEQLLDAGAQIEWTPPFMRKHYEHWVRNLRWDWCISRQRPFGVPFPVWFCRNCDEILVADEHDLPVDPTQKSPDRPCGCGSEAFEPEQDVMDTWATSALTPQITARWGEPDDLSDRVIPMDLRPQAHDIIRTWAFYTIVKSLLHTGEIPWRWVLISGHALKRNQKISKSKGVSTDPLSLIEARSADAIRYWACETRPGRDTAYSEDVVAQGQRTMIKLWNASRFALIHLEDYDESEDRPALRIIDCWLLSRLSKTIETASRHLESHDYTSAKEMVERFFWRDLCDNYLEFVKRRLYHPKKQAERQAVQYTLHHSLLTVLKLFAPILPYITEEIYHHGFAEREGCELIHLSSWPEAHPDWTDPEADTIGELAISVVEAVRKEKSLRKLSMAKPVRELVIRCDAETNHRLEPVLQDIQDLTYAEAASSVLDDVPLEVMVRF